MAFRNRLALFLIVTLIAVQGLTAVLVYGVLRDRLIDQGKQELRAATRAFKRDLDSLAGRASDAVDVLALDYPFRQAIAQRDHDTALSVLRNHGLRVDASRMILVDLDGSISVDTAAPAGTAAPPEIFPLQGLLHEAARSGHASALASLGQTICWTVVVSVRAPIPIGFIAACIPIDRTVLSNLTTLSPLVMSVALSNRPGDLKHAIAVADEVKTATITGKENLTLTTVLSMVEGSPPIIATFTYPLDEALRPYRALLLPMLLVLAGALAAALIGAVLIAHGLSRPLGALAQTATRIAGGDYTAPPRMTRRDEVGQLAAALSTMVEAVSQREAALTTTLRALETARDEAVQANNAKSQFLANMSHELRTPLNAVIGFGEVMQGEHLGPLGATAYQTYTTHIVDSGRHLLALVEEMFDLVKVEAGTFTLSHQTTQSGALIGEAAKLLEPAADAAGVRLVLHGETQTWPALEADPLKLKQVFINLIGNAIKFTPARGTVSISCNTTDTALTIRVVDTGIGMSAEEIPLIVKPFYRIASAYNGRYQGAGLGLPLAKAIVEGHGGSLRIESAPGEGTSVFVTLPLRAAGSGKASEAA